VQLFRLSGDFTPPRGDCAENLEKPSFMVPGQIYRFQIELNPTSLVFCMGHRIRVDISSQQFPSFWRESEYGWAVKPESPHSRGHQHDLPRCWASF